jgi:hypothetical protein
VRAKDSGEPAKRRERAVRAAARQALAQLLEPLAGFALDAGFSVQEVETLLRIAAVRSVARRQREVSQRVNISGIAASTGIPRAEISRILKQPEGSEADTEAHARQQQATNRILSAWHEEPQFTKPNGQPAELKIFGRGATFDTLVKRHGRGIPTRAMLDELERAQALEVLPKQRVRAKALVAAESGAGPRAIKAFGERGGQILASMLMTLRSPDTSHVIKHVTQTVHSSVAWSFLTRELTALVNTSPEFDIPRILLSLGERGNSYRKTEGRVIIHISYHSGLASDCRISSIKRGRRNLHRLFQESNSNSEKTPRSTGKQSSTKYLLNSGSR